VEPKPPKDPHHWYSHPELSDEYLRWPVDPDTQAIRELDDIIREWGGYPQEHISLWSIWVNKGDL